MRYRNKHPEIEAFRFGYDQWPEWFVKCVELGWAVPGDAGAILRTTYRGVEYVMKGDWVIQNYNGIPYGMDEDCFARIYEKCE